MEVILEYFITDGIDGLDMIMKVIASITEGLFKNDIVIAFIEFFEIMGFIMLGIGILFAIASFCVWHMEGNGDSPIILIRNTFIAIIIAYFLFPISEKLFLLSNEIRLLMTESINVEYLSITQFIVILRGPGNFGLVIVLILAALYIFLIIKIFFALWKRSAIFLLHICIGYLHIFSIPSGRFEGFFTWCRIAVSLIAANVIQMGFYLLGFSILTDFNSMTEESLSSLITGFAVLVVAAEVERMLAYFGLQPTGFGRRSATTAIVGINAVANLSKKVVSKKVASK